MKQTQTTTKLLKSRSPRQRFLSGNFNSQDSVKVQQQQQQLFI